MILSLFGGSNKKRKLSILIPVIYVAAAVLLNEEEKVLIVQRPPDKKMAYLWEFPGGKIEQHENPEKALSRELYEEIGIHVNPEHLESFTFVSHSYETFHLVMLVYLCRQWEGQIILKENQAQFEWVSLCQIQNYYMPEADKPIIACLQSSRK